LVPQRLNRVPGQFNDGMAEADAIAVLGPDCRWRVAASRYWGRAPDLDL